MSRPGFIHKIKVVTKELRETKVWLLIIAKASLIKPQTRLQPIIKECDELISIFVKSTKTAKGNSLNALLEPTVFFVSSVHALLGMSSTSAYFCAGP